MRTLREEAIGLVAQDVTTIVRSHPKHLLALGRGTGDSWRSTATAQSTSPGSKVSGHRDGGHRASAAHLALLERGYQPIEVKEQKSVLQFEITKKLVPRKDVMHFSRQLSVFVEAGIPIMEALEVIAEETTDKLLQRVLLDMIDRIQAGDTFASAAAAHPRRSPTTTSACSTSAELTGNLDNVLDQLARLHRTRHRGPVGKITGAMIYPAVVAVMAVVVVVVLADVRPAEVRGRSSSRFNAKLPLPTRMLLSVSNFVSTWWWAILGVIVVRRRRRHRAAPIPIGQGVARLDDAEAPGRRRPRAGGHHRADLPGPRVAWSRAGVDLPDAMAVTAESSNNAVYREGLDHIREQMMEGQGLAEPLARDGALPGGGPPDVPRRRGDRNARPAARDGGRPSTTGSST